MYSSSLQAESVSIAINTTQNEGNVVDWRNFDFGSSGVGEVRPLDAHDQ
jgi:ABC-type taurine transport system substrate-binding protein